MGQRGYEELPEGEISASQLRGLEPPDMWQVLRPAAPSVEIWTHAHGDQRLVYVARPASVREHTVEQIPVLEIQVLAAVVACPQGSAPAKHHGRMSERVAFLRISFDIFAIARQRRFGDWLIRGCDELRDLLADHVEMLA